MAGGYEPIPAMSYDCDAGFANWVKGWSVPKKSWCCQHAHKGCIGSGDMLMGEAAGHGYGAGAQHGNRGLKLLPSLESFHIPRP